MPPFTPVYVINPLETPRDPVARAQLYSVAVGGPTDWASSPMTTPGWGNTLAAPVNTGSAVSAASVTAPDATTADRQAAGTAAAGSPAAVVQSVSPNSGPTAGGTQVTITGTRFSRATGVTFKNVLGTWFTVVNDSKIIVFTPPGAVGAGDVVVQSPNGNGTGTGAYTYT
jgi:hypothetical protein